MDTRMAPELCIRVNDVWYNMGAQPILPPPPLPLPADAPGASWGRPMWSAYYYLAVSRKVALSALPDVLAHCSEAALPEYIQTRLNTLTEYAAGSMAPKKRRKKREV